MTISYFIISKLLPLLRCLWKNQFPHWISYWTKGKYIKVCVIMLHYTEKRSSKLYSNKKLCLPRQPVETMNAQIFVCFTKKHLWKVKNSVTVYHGVISTCSSSLDKCSTFYGTPGFRTFDILLETQLMWFYSNI